MGKGRDWVVGQSWSFGVCLDLRTLSTKKVPPGAWLGCLGGARILVDGVRT